MFSEIKNSVLASENLPETFTYKLALQMIWMELCGCLCQSNKCALNEILRFIHRCRKMLLEKECLTNATREIF